MGVAHLVCVTFGACDWLPEENSGPVASALRWYAAMSGADSGYGFFAPEVGTPHRARFLLVDHEGSCWSDTFDQASSSEAWLRLRGIVETAFMDGKAGDEPAWRQRLIRSWAATMFSRHPRALWADVIVEAYDIPTRADYRAGARPGWKSVYRARVQRQARADQERTDE
jgi:hypothetical protein